MVNKKMVNKKTKKQQQENKTYPTFPILGLGFLGCTPDPQPRRFFWGFGSQKFRPSTANVYSTMPLVVWYVLLVAWYVPSIVVCIYKHVRMPNLSVKLCQTCNSMTKIQGIKCQSTQKSSHFPHKNLCHFRSLQRM